MQMIKHIVLGDNNMKNFKIKMILFLTFFIGLININGNTLTVHAADPPSTTDVYNAAPDGLKLDGLIDIPAKYKDGTVDSAQLKTDFPVNIIQLLTSKKDDSSASNTQISSFWGKHSDGNTTDNYFDLTQPQVISAWVYFGDTYHTYADKLVNSSKDETYDGNNDSDQVADGLALVLQNDDNGAQAISKAIGSGKVNDQYKTSGGQSLGVWGTGTTNSSILSTANDGDNTYNILNLGGIQNSFALEYDTVNNYKSNSISNILTGAVSGSDDSMDLSNNVKGQHIAWGFPGEASTYKQTSQTWTNPVIFGKDKTIYQNSLNHKQGNTGNNLYISGYGGTTQVAVNAWKHITFKYTPPESGSTTAKFTYSFNDQNRDGSAKPFNESNTVANQSIDIKSFNSTDKRVRWGFTAATGSQYSKPQTYSVILQRMPNVANLKSETTLTDLSQFDSSGNKGRKISDLYQDSNYRDSISPFLKTPDYNVANGDKLQFDYDLDYISGTIGTGKISASIVLPKNVDFKAGVNGDLESTSIGKITYSGDGAQDSNSYEISASDITTNSSGEKIVKISMDSLSTIGQKASVALYGIADSTKTPILVESEAASLRSDSYIEDLSSPAFIINDQLKIATTDTTTQDVEYDEVPNKITGTLNYANGSKIGSMQFYTKINNNKAVAAEGKMVLSSDELTGSYTIDSLTSADKSNGQLHIGKNTVEVYAIDAINRVSNVITYTINVKDFANLILKADKLDFSIYKQDSAVLESTIKYDNDGTFETMPLKLYWNVDGTDLDVQKIPATGKTDPIQNLSVEMKGEDLGVGDHTIKLYASDGTRNSNTVTYHVTVTDKTLIAKAENDSRTVNNNDYVNLTGSYAYSDDSEITNSSGAKVTYTIRTEDGVQDPVSYYSKDGKIDLTLRPILMSTQPDNALINLSYSNAEKILNDSKSPGLRVGRNEITVTVNDTNYESNTLTYVVNVPDITPKASSKNPIFKFRNSMVLDADITFTYDDPDYEFNPSRSFFYYKGTSQTDSEWKHTINGSLPKENAVTPQDLSIKLIVQIGSTPNLPSEPDNSKLHKFDIMAIDPYGRKSNIQSYEATLTTKELSLKVKDYKFASINQGFVSNEKGYVPRDGSWDIDVTSYKSPWYLYAQQTADFTKKNSDGSTTTMPALMVYENNNKSYGLGNMQLIASDPDSMAKEEVTNIGDSWNNDKGIVLAVNGMTSAGTYTGGITWTLVDSAI